MKLYQCFFSKRRHRGSSTNIRISKVVKFAGAFLVVAGAIHSGAAASAAVVNVANSTTRITAQQWTNFQTRAGNNGTINLPAQTIVSDSFAITKRGLTIAGKGKGQTILVRNTGS